MVIDQGVCTGCQECVPYCPMSAISPTDDGSVRVDLDECVECAVCIRSSICPVDAIKEGEFDEMRLLRRTFSDPLLVHKSTSVPGRGTEEMKTNEVTGRFRRGHAGVAVELGRPGTGTRFYDVEKVAMAMAPVVSRFEPKNPVTALMVDGCTGKLRDDVLNEKVLSAIVEADVELERLQEVLERIGAVASELDTVFSLDLVSRVHPDNTVPTVAIAGRAGFTASANGKTNVGLGRPLAREEE